MGNNGNSELQKFSLTFYYFNSIQVVIEYAANMHFYLAHSGVFTNILYVVIDVAAYLHFIHLAHSCILLSLMCTFAHTCQSSPISLVSWFLPNTSSCAASCG
jgi:hypothetical protein